MSEVLVRTVELAAANAETHKSATASQVGSEPTGSSAAPKPGRDASAVLPHVQPQDFQNNANTNRVLSTAGGAVFILNNNTALRLGGGRGGVLAGGAQGIHA